MAKFPIFGASDDDPGAGPSYAFLCSPSLINWDASEANRHSHVSEDCWVSEFTVTLEVAPGVGKSRTFTVGNEFGASDASVTISGTNTTGTWTGPPVFITEGDSAYIIQTGSGTPAAPLNVHWHVFLNTIGNKTFIMGANSATASTSVTQYTAPFGAGAWTTTSKAQDMPVPTNGTLTKAWVYINGSSDVGDSYVVSMRLNDTTDALACTIADFDVWDTQTGSVALSAGDNIQIKCVPSGTPTAVIVSWCFTFEPTINGESICGYGAATTLSTTATQYGQPIGNGNGWGTSEADRSVRLPGCSLKKLYVRLHVAPGAAKSRTITMRDNAANSALTVTISGTNLTGNDTTHTVTHTANQTISMQSVPTLAPAAAQCHFGYVIVTPQPAPKARSYIY